MVDNFERGLEGEEDELDEEIDGMELEELDKF